MMDSSFQFILFITGVNLFLECYIFIYYIDKSVIVENISLKKFIRNYIRDSSGVFSISSLVRISLTSFPAFTLFFLCAKTLLSTQ